MAKKMYGDFRIQDQKKLQLSDNDNSHVVSLRAPNLTGDVDLVLPSNSAAGFMKNDGSGNLSFSSISLTADVSGVLPLANGGTNKNITASAGAIVYSDADSFELSAVGTSGQFLKSNGSSAPSWESFSNVDHGSLSGLGDDDHTQYILVAGTRAFSADQSMGGFKLTNLAAPSSANDAVNKAYVDAAINGLDWKQSVRVASTANVAIATGLENGDTIDGVTLATGDRVLLKDQSTASENGIYVVVASGAASRSTDADASAEVTTGLAVWVAEGTANADSGWVLTTNDPITLDTTSLTFAQFTGGGGIVAGSGLLKTGNTIDFQTADTSLTVNADSAQVNVNASGAIIVSSGLVVNVDDSTIERSANALQLKAGGITNSHINASAAIAYSKLNLSGSIVNADVSASAAIAYSKLNLSSSIVNADISASAAIAFSKLASLPSAQILVGNGSNVATAVAVSGDVTISNAGDVQIASGAIVNADVNASAAIALSKLESFRQVATWTNANGTSKTVTHSFSTNNVMVQVEDDNGEEVFVDTIDKQAGQVVLTSSSAPSADWKVYLIHMGS